MQQMIIFFNKKNVLFHCMLCNLIYGKIKILCIQAEVKRRIKQNVVQLKLKLFFLINYTLVRFSVMLEKKNKKINQ